MPDSGLVATSGFVKVGIDELEWMSPATKVQAQAKLAVPCAGRPRENLVGRSITADLPRRHGSLIRCRDPVDHREWRRGEPADSPPNPKPDSCRASLTAGSSSRFALVPMPRYIELKLASGMAAPHRGKDLVDVQELIKSAVLPAGLADELHPWVRDKFLELWRLAQAIDPF